MKTLGLTNLRSLLASAFLVALIALTGCMANGGPGVRAIDTNGAGGGGSSGPGVGSVNSDDGKTKGFSWAIFLSIFRPRHTDRSHFRSCLAVTGRPE